MVSILTCLALLLTLLPTAALAAEGETTEGTGEGITAPEPQAFSVEFATAAPTLSLLANGDATTTSNFTTFGDQLTGEYAPKIYEALCDPSNLSRLRNGEAIPVTLEERTFSQEDVGLISDYLSQDTSSMLEAVRNAVAAFDRDRSDIFWTSGSSAKTFSTQDGERIVGSYYPTAGIYTIGVDVTLPISGSWQSDGRDIAADETTVSNQLQVVIGQIPQDADTAYEKLLSVHNWLTQNNAYNTDAAETGSSSDSTPWEAISALTSQDGLQPVCEGYARAFKLICDELNIPCVLVSGTGTNSSGQPEAHMWNYVQIDNKWYAVDVTWDDPIVNGSDTTGTSTYFLVGGNTPVNGETTFNQNHNPQSDNFLSNGHMTFAYPVLSAEKYTPPATLTSIVVTPAASNAAVPTSGNTTTVSLTATGNYDNKTTSDLTSSASWSVSGGNTTGVSVSNGVVTIQPSAAAGSVTVTATSGSITGSATITLTKTPATLTTLTISGSDSVSVPSKTTYTAAGRDQYGADIGVEAVTWSIQAPAPDGVSIDQAGNLTVENTAQTGSVTITAAAGTVTGTKEVTISRGASVATSVVISNAGNVTTMEVPTISTIGETKTATLQFSAQVLDQYGEVVPDAAITEWKIRSNAIAEINNQGLLTIDNQALSELGTNSGTLTVTAVYGEITSNEITITVSKETSAASFLEILKGSTVIATDTIVIPGAENVTETYTARVYDQYGSVMDDYSGISWSLDGDTPAGVSVSGTGSACTVLVPSATQAGTGTLTAQIDGTGSSSSVALTFTTKADAQVRFVNAPSSVSLDDGTVTLNISVGNPGETPAGYTWQVSQGDALAMPSDPSYTVSDTATFNIVGVGKATITAVYESETTYGTASVEIEVTGRSLSGASVVVSNITDYTGSAQNPTVTVTLNGTPLTQDADYTVSYTPAEVKDAGEYTVTVTGNGDYSGTVQTTFTIGKATPNLGQVSYASAAPIYTSTASSAVNLSRANTSVDGTLALAADTVFTAGTSSYTWVFTPSDTANYETVTGQIQLTVTENSLTSISASTPNRFSYQFGDTFDLSSVTVTAHYANGDSRTLTAGEVAVVYPSGGSSFAMGDTSVTLSYQGQTCQVTGLTVDRADYSDQRINVDVVYTDTALKTVDFSSKMPENYTGMRTDINAAASTTSILRADSYHTGSSTPLVTFALRDGLTEDVVGSTATLSYLVGTDNYKEFTVTITITVLAESLAGKVNVSVPSFASVQTGYAQPAAQAITISNTSDRTITIDRVEVSGTSFILAGGSDNISISAGGANTSWTIRPAAGLPAGSYTAMVTVYYNGGTANVQVPVSFTVTAPAVTPTPDPSPSRPSGGSSGGSSSSGDSSNPNVTTDDSRQPGGSTTTETTARPGASVSGGSASSSISASMGETIVEQATENRSDTVVIAPDISGNVDRTEVSIPNSVVDRIGSDTDADLVVSTPVADVTISNAGLSQLANQGGRVSVTAETTGSTVTLEVSAGGSTVSSIRGGVTVSVPAENAAPGTVAVLVHEDGTREVIRKSLADGGTLIVPLDGSATVEIVDNAKTFTDVPAGNWAADAVAFASGHELFNGTSETTFSPDRTMTRGMLAQVLYNLESNPLVEAAGSFSDVGSGAYYADAVEWANTRGIVTGYGDGSFGPDNTITRQQLAVMLYRYARAMGYDTSATTSLAGYADAGQVSGYAAEAMAWANAEGLVNGTSASTLSPNASATRAQVATILMRFCQRYA